MLMIHSRIICGIGGAHPLLAPRFAPFAGACELRVGEGYRNLRQVHDVPQGHLPPMLIQVLLHIGQVVGEHSGARWLNPGIIELGRRPGRRAVAGFALGRVPVLHIGSLQSVQLMPPVS